MSKPLAELLSNLTEDSWRCDVGFSPELDATNRRLFDPAATESEIEEEINAWIGRYQPCLFGRIAAKSGHLSYCILRASDFYLRDEEIQAKIQSARTAWTREGFSGRKSGFVIIAISEQIAKAMPDETVKQIALKLCSLYLIRNVTSDEAHHDEIFLERDGPSRVAWKWLAGVNYFCSQGDKRWWHDHRFPGGMAFSVNSVGHMVKSAILSNGMIALDKELGLSGGEWEASKVDSLEMALGLAMRTIDRATNTVSGPATSLWSIPRDDNDKPVTKCPFKIPRDVAERDWTKYRGHYHTDFSVPSEYFLPDVSRPSELPEHILDFTYLYYRDARNPDHTLMGEGRQIRENDHEPGESQAGPTKGPRMEPELVPIDEQEILRRALKS